MSLLISTAYAPPIVYMALLYAQSGGRVLLEGCEHIVKQSWRNRCDIVTANGIQSLTIPIERPLGGKTPIREILISEHGSWRHQHEQAIISAYGSSPYFEYYWPDLKGFYERRYRYLWDFNLDLLTTLCRLLHLDITLEATEGFAPPAGQAEDWRYRLHPRELQRERLGGLKPYYQPFAHRHGFVPELSIYDLLMNMGPESLLYLRDYSPKLIYE